MQLLTFLGALGKIFWPFIKEYLLQNDSFGDFVRKNKSMCFWLIVMFTMFGVVIYFYDATLRARASETIALTELQRSKQQLALLKQQITLEQADRDLKTTQLRELRAEMTALEAEHSDQDELVAKYEVWMAHCGIDPEYSGKGFPQCRTVTVNRPAPKAKVAPRPRPKSFGPFDPTVLTQPVEPPPKKGFWRRVKEAFGGKKADEEKN